MKSRQLTLVSILCVLNHGVEAFVGSFNNAKFRSGTIRSYATASVDTIEDSYDVTIVGSGIGGLSCAAMLTLYGYKVAVFESHYAPGGAAHGYSVKGKNGGLYHFDTGPSFFSGLNPNIDAKLSNPLRTILNAIGGEEVECIPYKTFGLLFPEGS